jgi:hypothetical protein
MAKVKRSVLKNLVKECLVEILMEGLYEDEVGETLQESVQPRPRKHSRTRPDKEMVKKIQSRKKMLNEKIIPSAPPAKKPKDFMGGVTNDPIMAQIFADTANTTLPRMVANDRGASAGRAAYVPADGAAQVVHDNELGDLFEGSSNWATLAFNDDKKAR